MRSSTQVLVAMVVSIALAATAPDGTTGSAARSRAHGAGARSTKAHVMATQCHCGPEHEHDSRLIRIGQKGMYPCVPDLWWLPACDHRGGAGVLPDDISWRNASKFTVTLTFKKWPFSEHPGPFTIAPGDVAGPYHLDPRLPLGPPSNPKVEYEYTVSYTMGKVAHTLGSARARQVGPGVITDD